MNGSDFSPQASHLPNGHRCCGLDAVHDRHGLAVVVEGGLVAPASTSPLRWSYREPKRLEGLPHLGITPTYGDLVQRATSASVATERHGHVPPPSLVRLRSVMRVLEAQTVVHEQLEAGRNRWEAREDLVDQALVRADPLVCAAALPGDERKGWDSIPKRKLQLRRSRLGLGVVGGHHPGGVGVLLDRSEMDATDNGGVALGVSTGRPYPEALVTSIHRVGHVELGCELAVVAGEVQVLWRADQPPAAFRGDDDAVRGRAAVGAENPGGTEIAAAVAREHEIAQPPRPRSACWSRHAIVIGVPPTRH